MWFLWQLYTGKTFSASLSHAVMATSCALLIYRYPDHAYGLAQFSLINSLAYFLGDLFVRFNWSKLIHHLVALAAFGFTFQMGPAVWIYTAKGSGILEASGPFWTFLRLRLEQSDEIKLPKWYNRLVAGAIFTTTFFLARFLWYNYYVWYETPEEIPTGVVLSIFLPFTGLNFYWMGLLLKGLTKELSKNLSQRPFEQNKK